MKTNFQDVIRKYCKEIAKQIYNLDLEIYFQEGLNCVGVFRDDDFSPAFADPIKLREWRKKPIASITFDKLLFTPNCFKNDLGRCWNYMLHEITHIEIDINYNTVTKRFSHSKKFNSAFQKNLRKVVDLKNKFKMEATR